MCREKRGVVEVREAEAEKDAKKSPRRVWKEDKGGCYQIVIVGGVVWIHSALTGECVIGTVLVTYYLRSYHLHETKDAERPS